MKDPARRRPLSSGAGRNTLTDANAQAVDKQKGCDPSRDGAAQGSDQYSVGASVNPDFACCCGLGLLHRKSVQMQQTAIARMMLLFL